MFNFTTWHDLDTKHTSVHISILWMYYPGSPASFSDPEETDDIELVAVNIPDALEGRREMINWIVQDRLAEIQEEALEQIQDYFKRNGGDHESPEL